MGLQVREYGVTGEGRTAHRIDIESGWAEYKKEIKAIGFEQVIQEYQEWYDENH